LKSPDCVGLTQSVAPLNLICIPLLASEIIPQASRALSDAGRCATQLNDSGGPGFKFLTIVCLQWL